MKRLGYAGYIALVLTVLTAVFGLFVQSLEWEPQASFDIIGILWLLSNIPTLAAWLLEFFLMALTIWSWWLALVERSSETEFAPMSGLEWIPPNTESNCGDETGDLAGPD